MMTAPSNEDAPDIVRWESQLAWYLYGRDGGAYRVNSNSAAWIPRSNVGFNGNVRCNAIWPLPAEFGSPGAIFVLEGCRDGVKGASATISLFPEILKSELHPIRATVEAYNNTRCLTGWPGSAAGLMLDSNSPAIEAKVVSGGASSIYLIDRME